MATIAFTESSDQLTSAADQAFNPIPPREDGGRVRVKQFTFTAASALVAASYVDLVEIPSEAVILDTVITAITVAGSGKFSIGYTDKSAPEDSNKAALVAATAAVLGSTAGQRGKNVDGITSVFATTSVATLAIGDTFSGFVEYVVNS